MTVTQRRNRPAADAPDQQQRTTIEPGIKVTCDFCHTEITNTVRFKCAVNECRDLDICALCFSEGKEGQGHQAWHDYMVEEPLTTPIFDPDWGADEEILLISGLITYGLGNWLEVAAYIGTRTKEDCERHYCQTFLGCTPEGQPYDREKDMAVPPHTAGGNGAANGEADGTANGTQNGGGADPERIQGQAEEAEESKRKRRYMPPMSRNIIFDPEEYQIRKKARIEEVRKPQALPAPSGPMVSAPTNHEVGGYMPGRLEFEHEVDNDAEVAVKDMEFGLVWKYGGDEQPAAKVTVAVVEEEEEEDDDDEDDSDEDEGENGKKNGKVKDKDKAKAKEKAKSEAVKEEKEEKKEDEMDVDGVETKPDITVTEADATNGSPKQSKDKGKDKEENPEETPTDDIEDEGELEVKLALLDIYFSKLDKREEAKELIFDRGLTDYKRIQAAERRKPKDEREIINRYKVFAKLQTALDFEVLTEGLVYEQILRKRIAELQEYRRMGVTTAAEAEVYEAAKITRAGYRTVAPRDRVDLVVSGSRVNAGQNRYLHGVVSTPPPGVRAGTVEISGRLPSAPGRRPPAPLNLANSQSLDLLSTDEQNLCSRLRVLPKPYLSIKEMYIRENERRHGGLKRRDARKMLKIDVTKSGGIFDFLVKQGYLRLSYDQNATAPQPGDVQPGKAGQVNGHGTGVSGDGTQRPATGLNITSMSPSRKMNGVSGLDGA